MKITKNYKYVCALPFEKIGIMTNQFAKII
jgi:hypothetical protein